MALCCCLAAVEWTFLDNPYFPAGTLSKTYTFTCDGGSANKLGLQQRGAVVAGPQWFAPTPGERRCIGRGLLRAHASANGHGQGVSTPRRE